MTRAHRLAAIMFTDIQGYTRLMQEDESEAIAIRTRHRDIFQQTTLQYGGEIIQYYGDGTLSIFESCVDAVRCAQEMQQLFQTDPALPVRIGIHLGDIVVGKEDIIGDSVNVASRVESLGIPGSVLISGKVYEEIQNKQEFNLQNLGKFHFKNDKHPRKIYALTGGNLIVPKKHELKGKLEPVKFSRHITMSIIVASIVIVFIYTFFQNKIPGLFGDDGIEMLAVLPLYDRMGLSDDESYIIEGLHEEIIVRLSEAGLNVKPYSVMAHYRDTDKSLDLIGQELNVDALVEGSVFRSGDQYRIRVQIIEVENQEYLAEPYESQAEFASIMSLYSDLVETIARQIRHSLSDEVQDYLNNDQELDPVAYDLYLKGRSQLNTGSERNIQEAIDLFTEALVLDSTFVDAHVSLIESYLLLGFTSDNPIEQLDKFKFHLSKAIDQDPFFKDDHHLMAMVRIFENWDWKGAISELKEAMKDAPNTWEPYDSYCQLMWAIGDMEESVWAGEQAVKKDPEAHFAHCDLAWAYYFSKDYERTRDQVERTIDKFGEDCPHHMGLLINLDIDEKRQIGQSLVTVIDRIKKLERKDRPYTLSQLGYAYALEGNDEEARNIISQLNSTGMPGSERIHVALGEYDKAFELLNRAIIDRSLLQMFVIKKAPWFDPIRDDPRFEEILTKMGLADHQLN